MSIKIPPEQYTSIAVEIARDVVQMLDLNSIREVGMERVVKDVFDFVDVFTAELAVRLDKNAKE